MSNCVEACLSNSFSLCLEKTRSKQELRVCSKLFFNEFGEDFEQNCVVALRIFGNFQEIGIMAHHGEKQIIVFTEKQ